MLHVEQGGVAEHAGLEAGHRIVAINGVPLDNLTHPQVSSIMNVKAHGNIFMNACNTLRDLVGVVC